jgi:hypothetical protein
MMHGRSGGTILGLLAGVIVSAPLAGATVPAPESGEKAAVGRALAGFLTAFENLNWERFRAAFDEHATVFFPTPNGPGLAEGRADYEARFRQVFEETRRAAPSGPPFQRLEPQHLRVQVLSQQVALVTFQLQNDKRIGRRTILFCKAGKEWRILHLHASNMALQ